MYEMEVRMGLNETQLDSLVQNCSISITNALEILQSCTKPSNCLMHDAVAVQHLVVGDDQYSCTMSHWLLESPGVGVTMPVLSIRSGSLFYKILQYWLPKYSIHIGQVYSSAALRLSNMNVIEQ